MKHSIHQILPKIEIFISLKSFSSVEYVFEMKNVKKISDKTMENVKGLNIFSNFSLT